MISREEQENLFRSDFQKYFQRYFIKAVIKAMDTEEGKFLVNHIALLETELCKEMKKNGSLKDE